MYEMTVDKDNSSAKKPKQSALMLVVSAFYVFYTVKEIFTLYILTKGICKTPGILQWLNMTQ